MNSDFIEMIKTRRSVRSFSEREIPAEVLRIIAETAVYAPPMLAFFGDKQA